MLLSLSNSKIKLGGMLVLSTLALAACTSAPAAPSATPASNTGTESNTVMTGQTPQPSISAAVQSASDSSTSSAAVKTVAIEAGSFYFNPKEIKIKKGEKVKIQLTAKDMMHDFVIDELNVKVPVAKAGETTTVEFTPDKTGRFEYYCSVGQHRQKGQVGTIIVE